LPGYFGLVCVENLAGIMAFMPPTEPAGATLPPRSTALVTGASGGIGLELARVFALRGHDLVIVARDHRRLEDLAADLRRSHGREVTPIAMDLARPDAADELVGRLPAAGAIDALVNNAGFAVFGPFAESPLEAELEMIQLNVTTPTHLTKLVLPGMLARGSGRILNVASTAAFQPGPLMAVYYATKAYLLSFTEALAEELAGTGVGATALCPGPTASGFQARARMEDSKLVKDRKIADAASVARAGYDGLMSGKRIVVPGLRNKALTQAIRFSPRRVTTAMVRNAQRRAGDS
jgi:uncharacterized protein